MKILVTGGCGFIGSNFIRYLLESEKDVNIVNLDALTYAGNLANLADCEPDSRYSFHHGNITDAGNVDSLFGSSAFDLVINFAAESHVDRSIENSAAFLDTNILGTQTLLDASRRHSVGRYVQVSTDEVYGSLGPTDKFTEETPLSPRSPYSASKASADHLVSAAHHTHGLDTVITRCSNNYGPWQFPEKLIPLTILNALENRKIPMYGDGLYVRDWLHVIDHCRGIWMVARKGHAGEVYNMGGNCEKPNLETVRLILKVTGRPESLIGHVTDRKGHDRRYAIDFSKIRRELGWSPTVSFETGLAETVQWYRDHAEWLEGVTSGAYRDYYTRMYAHRGAVDPTGKEKTTPAD